MPDALPTLAPPASDLESLGRRFRSCCDRAHELEGHYVALADDDPRKLETLARLIEAEADAARVDSAILRRPPETIPEALVTAAHAFHRADALARLETVAPVVLASEAADLRRALAGIVRALATEVVCDLSALGRSDLRRLLRAELG